ncbi:putative spore coat protein, late developmental [Mizugakiibacter sediminis]|uniref:Spore coat protein, late developmental n=1 Tax=Mizugakiibacter sediminis TaxID=1475481 RepID=A0A0K8QPT5_9GAMM|nr:spore coat U domain-containing protein [Mizugakiibacter sediminis]GAP66686.1 putative spore coat protein, late developmental [Mizugakiibacter sediminis]
MKIKTALIAAGLALAGIGVQAQAGTDSATFNVTATVINSCKVVAANNIGFGNYDPAGANNTTPLDASGSVQVRCTKNTNAAVTLNQGANPATGSTCASPSRQMTDGGSNRLGYAIYKDAARSQPWGCDATNQASFTSTGIASPITLTTYGRVAAGQDVPAGSYTDTVSVTVTF